MSDVAKELIGAYVKGRYVIRAEHIFDKAGLTVWFNVGEPEELSYQRVMELLREQVGLADEEIKP